jgi:hypothetical protein
MFAADAAAASRRIAVQALAGENARAESALAKMKKQEAEVRFVHLFVGALTLLIPSHSDLLAQGERNLARSERQRENLKYVVSAASRCPGSSFLSRNAVLHFNEQKQQAERKCAQLAEGVFVLEGRVSRRDEHVLALQQEADQLR